VEKATAVSAARSGKNGKPPSALRSSVDAVNPQLRQPGNVLGPRAARTIAAILDATRQIFLVRGYAGTTIDDITRVAGVSRASFYTYFPSKRDALLALGADSLTRGMEMAESLGQISPDWDLEDLAPWVEQYFNVLEEHGSFAFAWTQAAHEDEEIRCAGQRGQLELCRRLGMALALLGGRPAEDPVETGLLVVAMLERGWAYSQLYAATLDKEALQRAAVRMLAAAARPSDAAGRTATDTASPYGQIVAT
jgi:AcrR family transcriptional regulator